jgi:hypothetical protein
MFPIFEGFMGSRFPPETKGRELICSAAVVDSIDGIGAVSTLDLSNKVLHTRLTGNTGVIQATQGANVFISANMERSRKCAWDSSIQCLGLSQRLLDSGEIAITHEDFVDGIFSQMPYTSRSES